MTALGYGSMIPTIAEGLDNRSLHGSYEVMRVAYGSHQQSAVVGVYDFDGNGRWTGTIVANVPGPVFAARVKVEGRRRGPKASMSTARAMDGVFSVASFHGTYGGPGVGRGG